MLCCKALQHATHKSHVIKSSCCYKRRQNMENCTEEEKPYSFNLTSGMVSISSPALIVLPKNHQKCPIKREPYTDCALLTPPVSVAKQRKCNAHRRCVSVSAMQSFALQKI